MDNKTNAPKYASAFEFKQERQLDELLAALLRGKWVILAAFLVVLGLTALYTFMTKPVYEATAMVVVAGKAAPSTLPVLDFGASDFGTRVGNELQTLKARSTALAVAQELLARTYMDSAKTKEIPIIMAGQEGEEHAEKARPELVADRIQLVTDFTPVKESDVIRISVRRHDPLEAALIADTYTRVDAEKNTAASRSKSRSVREFLETQLADRQAALDSAERALKTYMKSSGVVSLDAATSTVVTQLAQMEANRNALDVDISTREKTLNSYKQQVAVQEPNVARAMGESSDTYIRLLQEQLARLEVQRDVVVAQNPEMTGDKSYSEKLNEIDMQIASLKKTLKKRTEAYLGTLVPGESTGRNDAGGTTGFLAAAKQRIIEQQIELDGMLARKKALDASMADYEKQFRQIPDKNMDLAKLQRTRLSDEKLYLLVQEKYNEAVITESSDFGTVNVLDPAVIPRKPVSPNVILNLFFGALSGLFLGVVIVIIGARMDDRIRRPEDLKKHGVTPLGILGTIETSSNGHGRAIPTNGKNGQLHPADPARVDNSLVAYASPLSAMSEGYRHLRTNLRYVQPDNPVRTMVITSPRPKEGKSTTVSNLAISFAQGEQRVLLVDGDLRRPNASSLFGIKKDPGLSDVIMGKVPFDKAVHRNVMVDYLDILPSGIMPPNPAEILGSHRMEEFIEQVKTLYDMVIFDSPPLLAVTDAAVIASMVDAAVIVINAGRTGFGSLERSAEILRGVGRNPTGVVLNNYDATAVYGGAYGRRNRDNYTYGYGYTVGGRGNIEKRRPAKRA